MSLAFLFLFSKILWPDRIRVGMYAPLGVSCLLLFFFIAATLVVSKSLFDETAVDVDRTPVQSAEGPTIIAMTGNTNFYTTT